MSYAEAVALVIGCWVLGWAFGFKFRQLRDALNAT